MNSDICALPSDVLRIIWGFLSLPDVIRFGMTAKNMFDLTWPCYQELVLDREWPIEALSFVLSRDLSHVHQLELCYLPSDTAFYRASHKISDMMKQIETLKFSKLTNLRSFITDINFPASKVAKHMNEIILVNTQLQSLGWYSASLEQNFNIGQFLSNHTRLITLIVETDKNLNGVNLLTRLEELTLSFCNNLDDDTLADLMTLTRLTSLDIACNEHTTDRSFTKITNLTNLELLEIKHASGPTSFNVLQNLPKLSNFALNYPWDPRQEDCLATISIIGQLSNLTSLRINNFDGELNFGLLTGLTNLLSLEIDTHMESADFSAFTKLTRLVLRPSNFKVSNLPPNLLVFNIATFQLDSDSIERICNTTSLNNLTLSFNQFDPTVMARWLTQLTGITELTILPNASKDLLPALERLPNLANLTFSKMSDDIVEDLSKLTQVMEFYYWEGYKKGLKDKLPFRVVFIGDPSKTDGNGVQEEGGL